MSIENFDGANSFTELHTNDSSDEADDNMADSDQGSDAAKEQTFTKDYVDAHAGEGPFYHTGNGWYKKGKRKIVVTKHAKDPNSTERAVTREADGTLAFNTNESIHRSQLFKFPGVEFNHCGNGWYKAGPSKSGKKSSVIVPIPEPGDDEEEDQEDEEDDIGDGTVSKAYKEAHPDIDWVHRGNGRYKRKDVIVDDASVTPAASSSRRASTKLETTYSKAYVEAHSGEDFYHTGNARYKRGTKPPANTASIEDDLEDEDSDLLYSKDYVRKHPEQEFHHRGQGRYKLGPKPSFNPQDDAQSNGGVEALFHSDYVDRHPNETFYHKGQGRWARGLPPFGSSNKVAVRGPDAKDRAARLQDEEEEDDGTEKPPGLTALVLKADGPMKFPNIEWHYRGGGKWSRLSKEQWYAKSKGLNYDYQVETVSRYRGNKHKDKFRDGPQAQLQRDTVAENGEQDYDGVFTGGEDTAPKPKRRGRMKRGGLQTKEHSKHSSNEQSKARTPKPPMLTEEEDRLTDSDLPSLYREEWSDVDSDEDPEVAGLLRANHRPLTSPQAFVKALTKYDPKTRPITSLTMLAENSEQVLDLIQQEWLALEKITAPHARIPRKPAKGGRLPIDPAVFEDKKEAELYDYAFNPHRIGFQDPQAQQIQRDAEGRELRKRRNRSGVEVGNGGEFGGEAEDLAPKRASRQPTRFTDTMPQQQQQQPARKKRIIGSTKGTSMTPDRATPAGTSTGYQVPTTGRWAGHIPKRIRELRDESVVTVRSEGGTERRVRKGRPPGSKNLHKRSDAGVKKGPRKAKVDVGEDGEEEIEVEGEEFGVGEEIEG